MSTKVEKLEKRRGGSYWFGLVCENAKNGRVDADVEEDCILVINIGMDSVCCMSCLTACKISPNRLYDHFITNNERHLDDRSHSENPNAIIAQRLRYSTNNWLGFMLTRSGNNLYQLWSPDLRTGSRIFELFHWQFG